MKVISFALGGGILLILFLNINNKKMKKALLIINLGTPDSPSYWNVFKYLREFLSDEKVLDINPVLRFFLVNFIICPFRSFSLGLIKPEIVTLNPISNFLCKF